MKTAKEWEAFAKENERLTPHATGNAEPDYSKIAAEAAKDIFGTTDRYRLAWATSIIKSACEKARQIGRDEMDKNWCAAHASELPKEDYNNLVRDAMKWRYQQARASEQGADAHLSEIVRLRGALRVIAEQIPRRTRTLIIEGRNIWLHDFIQKVLSQRPTPTAPTGKEWTVELLEDMWSELYTDPHECTQFLEAIADAHNAAMEQPLPIICCKCGEPRTYILPTPASDTLVTDGLGSMGKIKRKPDTAPTGKEWTGRGCRIRIGDRSFNVKSEYVAKEIIAAHNATLQQWQKLALDELGRANRATANSESQSDDTKRLRELCKLWHESMNTMVMNRRELPSSLQQFDNAITGMEIALNTDSAVREEKGCTMIKYYKTDLPENEEPTDLAMERVEIDDSDTKRLLGAAKIHLVEKTEWSENLLREAIDAMRDGKDAR